MTKDQVRAISTILASNFSHSKINKMLNECSIQNLGVESKRTNYGFILGSSKEDKLFKSLSVVSDIYIYQLIEKAVNPVLYTEEDTRDKYKTLVESLNKILMLCGKEIDKEGKIKNVVKATSLDEVDRRVNSLQRHFYERKIHPEVQKYCKADFLQKNYFEAVFEAAKGLAERVREMTGLIAIDGTELFDTALKTSKDTYLFFNKLTTKSEKSEQNGLRELLNAIFHLVRNPEAHTPKMNWPVEEDKALDVLTVISFAHKYLDLCNKMPGK